MAGELARTTKADADKLVRQRREATANPLLLVPAEAAIAVNAFLSMNAHLDRPGFELALAMRVRYWMDSERLSLGGLKLVFRTVCKPGRQAKHLHTGALLADLADEVDQVLQGERRADAQMAFLQEVADAKKNTAPASEVRDMVRLWKAEGQTG